jgi:nucleoside-diphosphate-sugar epimerase
MRVFVAGGSGVLGRRLVPLLVERGHEVTATTTSAAKVELLTRLGARGVVMDGLDAASVGQVVAAARPEVIVHQMTAPGFVHAGKPDTRSDRYFANTNRLRTEGTDYLLAAAEASGADRVVAQSNAAWNGPGEGGWDAPEQEPLTLHAGAGGQRGHAGGGEHRGGRRGQPRTRAGGRAGVRPRRVPERV